MEKINSSKYHDLITLDKLTVIKFAAEWCGPCRVLKPIIENIASKYPDVNFAEVDIDQEKEIAIGEGVRGVPAVIFYKNGKVLDTLVGLQPLQNYISRIESLS